MALISPRLKNIVFTRGVGVYLALVFTTLSVLLTFILVGVIELAATDSVKTRIGNSLAELAAQTSDKLDRGMFERYREVQLMTTRDDFDLKKNPAHDRLQLEALQNTYPYYAWIGMTDTTGKVVVSTKKILEGNDVSARPWFHNALNDIHVGDVHEAALLARLLPEEKKLSNEPIRFVDIAFPYRDKTNRIAGVLAAHLSWRWANDIQESIITPLDQQHNIESMIVDKAGKVLLGPAEIKGKTLSLPSLKRAQIASSVGGKGDYSIETWPDGKSYLVGYSGSKGYQSYPGIGWSVLVRQSETDAFLPLKQIQIKVFWSGIAAALLFSLLVLIAAQRITLPLRALAKSAQRIQNGEIANVAPPKNTYFEVQTLTASLNALVSNLLSKESALRNLNQTLEKRVEQRTAELAQALAKITASENRIQSIVETAQEAFVGVDLHGNIIDWNSQAEKMFGWSRKEVLGREMSSTIVPSRFKPILDMMIKSVAESAQPSEMGLFNRRMERIVIDRQNNEFPVEMTLGLVKDNHTYFFSAFLHDISDRKEIEAMKNDFISTVSHELRTPLTSLRGSIGLLVGGVAGDLPPQAKTLLEIASKNCARLVRMINDMLDIDKIESGKMRFEMANQALLPLAQQAIDATEGYAATFNVKLVLKIVPEDDKIHVSADRDKLIQVLINLLSNGIKFSPIEGTVTMEIHSYSKAGENWVRIAVIDHGCGIAKEFRNRIFQKFAMADSADSRKKDGTGLGLSISKSLIEQHGGEIDFFSEAGLPTEFFVCLPCVAAAIPLNAGGVDGSDLAVTASNISNITDTLSSAETKI
ncbi:sensor histidine kinase [Glaciimonas sp. PCH181]|uniref:sensor histidine kinase n=1 Tax=Glaciimonas sp. PCH181 TaxID=2133943 RepID=UPI000D38C30D|nr:sensor histidine kinase [Glaciimonas sp. PCH181]PUA17154.1 PAS domain-containing sensor histidine kinase [Glaciimonas sp. PCH181]